MPGPRAKQNAAKKKNKPQNQTLNLAVLVKTPVQRPPPLPPALQHRALNSLDELSSADWDEVVRIMCDHLKIPGMLLTCMLSSSC